MSSKSKYAPMQGMSVQKVEHGKYWVVVKGWCYRIYRSAGAWAFYSPSGEKLFQGKMQQIREYLAKRYFMHLAK